jgi:hypothetical protein
MRFLRDFRAIEVDIEIAEKEKKDEKKVEFVGSEEVWFCCTFPTTEPQRLLSSRPWGA